MGFLVKSEKLSAPTKGTNTNSDSSTSGSIANKKLTKGISTNTRSRDKPSIRTIQSTTRSYDSRSVLSEPTELSKDQYSLKQRIRAARKKGMKGDVYDLQYLVEEGPLSFRSFAFFGGFFMILASVLDFVETEEEPVQRLITFNLWLVGFITIQVEGRPFHMQVPFLYNGICLFFSFVRYVWGRGFLYFISGCFQFFLFTKYNMISGVYFMLLGTFSIVFGYKASVRLAGLRNSIQTKEEIKFMFHSFDKDRDGYLNSEEFRELLMAMGQNLEHNDFVAAMSAVDSDNNQMISYKDLETWWLGYIEDDLAPGASCVGYRRHQSNNPNAHLMT
jgi:hypothetical protein